MSTSSAAAHPSSVSRVQYLEGSPDDYRLTWPWAAAIALFGATMLSINLGDVRVLTFHEVVFAQPAKEMLRDDHWIVPTIAGDPYNDRTPLVAWSIAGAMWLFGTDAEWAVRTPNVVFSILAALVIAWMAARWFGKRVGILAGFIELTTLQVLTNGRLAEADMLLSLTVVAAM
ncbi:MAG: glycosyltransferase family 39 protein, partial [Planctomycetales bacterium]|nr:glycosyltransferase family 39 protein [Planctomycetales bacterium]